jgi:pullulanase-type alpha-1,6-glucosidase
MMSVSVLLGFSALFATFMALPVKPLASSADLRSINQALFATSPLSVTIAGSFQDELGCSADWQPACDATKLAYDANDDVWQGGWLIPVGDWAYKAALNNGWDENYGAGAQRDGPNVTLGLTEPMTVAFYYDHKSHWITDDQNDFIATAPGDYQSELGCSGDWDPGCMRSWLQDVDGDGIYVLQVTGLPPGSYNFKVALDQAWTENYGADGVPGGDNLPFSIASSNDEVILSWDSATKVPAVTVEATFDPDLVQAPPRDPIQDQVFYFVMPDRFQNGSVGNDQGGLTGGPLDHGHLPTDKGYYHGGDLQGLLDKMDYLEGLGVSAIWMTPMFKNRPVQGDGTVEGSSAGYHGYWVEDFTQVDPHFGTNLQLQQVINEAHARGMKIFLDVIANHTADVIRYQEDQYAYRSKEDYPYRDANGVEFDDRDYVGLPASAWPVLSPTISFPYTPIFETITATTVKVPSWLNDRIYYHNRGDSTFQGENSLYGDFYGLDDLFTEHPDVVNGMIDIHKTWVDYGVDGFRVDTVKHVNLEFWQQFAPAILEHAEGIGNDDFFIFGEVFSANEMLLSEYTTDGKLPGVLDFRFQAAARSYASAGTASDNLRSFFENDDYFVDADSNSYMLPTFIGNHDIGRFGKFIVDDNPGADDGEMLARSKLGHAMMYFARGVPVIYYGAEQGFTGDGGDKDAREDMFPSQVASYNDNDLIGTISTTAEANFDVSHPLYLALATYADLYQDHQALRRGAQIHRYSTDAAGIYAFTRIERDEKVEYLVAFNNAEVERQATFATYQPDIDFTAVYTADDATLLATLTSNAQKQVTVRVPPLGFVIYKSDSALLPRIDAPDVSITTLEDGAEVELEVRELDGNLVLDRMEVGAELSEDIFAEVTFAVRESGTTSYTVIGVDDNPPYRVFFDPGTYEVGGEFPSLDFVAIVNDLSGNTNADTVTGVQPVLAEEEIAAGYSHVVLHYYREDGDYGDHTTGSYNDYWGLHFWGNGVSDTVAWADPRPFWGQDDYGRFTWINLSDSSYDIGFIVHRGDTKDGTTADRYFNPESDAPEIWLKGGDPDFYTSRAAAQGCVTVHYHRPDGNYGTDATDHWGLHLWGDAIDPSEGTSWDSPKPPTGIDDFGAYYVISVTNVTQPVNFIIHRGDQKDPGPDQFFIPKETASAWVVSGDETVYAQRGGAEKIATLHYHRPADDYGDYGSSNYEDFWGLHTWGDAADPGWTTPRKPLSDSMVLSDTFGVTFKVPLLGDSPDQIGYILHRGDNKDPGPDQFLSFDTYGYEVWQLQGADPEEPYVLPILQAAIGGGDLSKYQAHWVAEDTLAWDVDFDSDHVYTLHYAPAGGIELSEGAISGGMEIPLTRDLAGLGEATRTKFPHLADFEAFKIDAQDLDKVPEALKGQLAVSERVPDAADLVIDATGLQIPGVLDDLYAFDGELGVILDDGLPTLRVWAPTAQNVTFHLFEDALSTTSSVTYPMSYDEEGGVWSVTGDASWMGKYYLYEVEVYVHSTGQVERNIVTDPYAVSLSMNSTRSQIVDLSDAGLEPPGWDSYAKPPLVIPEDVVIYELHVRDFSVNDTTVPTYARGTFKAFTYADSDGMTHLRDLADAGLTHLHLLPSFDFATTSVNEDKSQWQQPDWGILATYPPSSTHPREAILAVRDRDGFNWGYDPYHYSVPEGSYATDPDGPTRILEFREMVKTLNEAGLRLVMDVVYNHTNAAGQAPQSVLDRIVPGYYHRLDEDGNVTTSTCCPNTATEHTMMEKLMIDSAVMWAKYHKVDGFRFDLMGHHMKSNMLNVRADLDELTTAEDGVDGPKIIVYGEGWNFGEVADNARGVNATQVNMAGTGIGTFNDRLRDAVRGGGPFDSGDGLIRNQGFINGRYYDPNAMNSGSAAEKDDLLHKADQIRVGLAGNLADYQFVDRTGTTVKGSDVDYNGAPCGYTRDPQEHIVYVTAHDNQTLYDNNQYKMPEDATMAERVRAQNMGLSIDALSQGLPFFHAGIDLLRSKSFERDSYNSGDWFNKLFFNYEENNFGVGLPLEGQGDFPLMEPLLADPDLKPTKTDILSSVHHLQEMIEIRKSSPLFRMQTFTDVQSSLTFHNTGPEQIPGLIVMSLSDGEQNLDPVAKRIVVLFNATDETQTFTETSLSGAWLRLHPVQARGYDPVVKDATFEFRTGTFIVPPRTTAVFVQRDVYRPVPVPRPQGLQPW